MTITIGHVALFFGLTVFSLVSAGYHLLVASRAHEQLVSRAEDLGADPKVLSDPMHRKSGLVRWADRIDRNPKTAALRERLRLAYVKWKPSDFYIIRWTATLSMLGLCAGLFDLPYILTGLLTAATYFLLPRFFFILRRDAYQRAFNAQLVEVTHLLASALRAGMSVQQAIGQVSRRLPEPAAGEFRQVQHELTLGDTMAMALTRLRQRMRSRDLEVMINAIIIQHQAGGNLARVLSEMSNILTERQRLMSEINSLTADSKFSAMIVQLMPFILILMLRSTPIGEALLENTIGWVILGIFAVVQVGVYFLIQRITNIEV